MSDKFGDERDPYLYPALNVLRNRLGIRQAKNLQQAAFEMTALRAATLPLGPRVRGLPYLCSRACIRAFPSSSIRAKWQNGVSPR